jgi:hypothetical protein
MINDGLTPIEILREALTDRPDFSVDAPRRLLNRGLAMGYGSITNFPCDTYPNPTDETHG